VTMQTQKPDDVAQKQSSIKNQEAVGETFDKITICRPARARLSREETRARMEAFTKEREAAFIAAARE
jgi:hypothetical protein